MDEEKDLTELEETLIERLYTICDEYDFLLGVSVMCGGDEASKVMHQFLDTHPKATSSDILDYAVNICDKYNPHLNA